jgi:hypothetical protein
MPRSIPSHRAVRPFVAGVAALLLVATGAACSARASADSKTPQSIAAGSPTTTGTRVAGTGLVSAPARSPNPCTLVTAAEVKAILGVAAGTTGPTNENRGSDCKWSPGTGGSVLVQVFKGKEFYDPAVQAPQAKKLAGVGDTAYLDASGTTRVDVGFLKGDVAVFVDGFQVASSDAVVAAAKDAASKI